MSMSDTSSDIVRSYSQLVGRHVKAPHVIAGPLSDRQTPRDPSQSYVLVFSPHPDDECLTGGLALRLQKEYGWTIVNVAVSLGSDLSERPRRKDELAKACSVLGFACVLSSPEGFSSVTLDARVSDPKAWSGKVERMATLLIHYQPRVVLCPHSDDAHPAHQGTHALVMDALATLSDDFNCSVVLTEYWQPSATPNLMVEVDEADAAQLLDALSCHEGENTRNPYDRRFPAYLIDNVRRGTERIGGIGASSVDSFFAMLYVYGMWKHKKFFPSALKRVLTRADTIGDIF